VSVVAENLTRLARDTSDHGIPPQTPNGGKVGPTGRGLFPRRTTQPTTRKLQTNMTSSEAAATQVTGTTRANRGNSLRIWPAGRPFRFGARQQPWGTPPVKTPTDRFAPEGKTTTKKKRNRKTPPRAGHPVVYPMGSRLAIGSSHWCYPVCATPTARPSWTGTKPQ